MENRGWIPRPLAIDRRVSAQTNITFFFLQHFQEKQCFLSLVFYQPINQSRYTTAVTLVPPNQLEKSIFLELSYITLGERALSQPSLTSLILTYYELRRLKLRPWR